MSPLGYGWHDYSIIIQIIQLFFYPLVEAVQGYSLLTPYRISITRFHITIILNSLQRKSEKESAR